MKEVEVVPLSSVDLGTEVEQIKNAKVVPIIVIMIVGIILIIFSPVVFKFIGIVLVLYAAYVLYKFQTNVVAIGYEKGLVVVAEDKTMGQVVLWEDLFVWESQPGSYATDTVLVENKKNQIAIIQTFNTEKVVRLIEKHAPGKSKRTQLKDAQNKGGNSMMEVIRHFIGQGSKK